jgi:hypothetical protein
MVEVYDADPASLAVAAPTPPDLANTAAGRDQIASLGVPRYEIHEAQPLVIGPKRAGLAHEHSRFRYRNRPYPHLPMMYAIGAYIQDGAPTLFTVPVLRYMKTYGLSHEQLAMVSIMQRE